VVRAWAAGERARGAGGSAAVAPRAGSCRQRPVSAPRDRALPEGGGANVMSDTVWVSRGAAVSRRRQSVPAPSAGGRPRGQRAPPGRADACPKPFGCAQTLCGASWRRVGMVWRRAGGRRAAARARAVFRHNARGWARAAPPRSLAASAHGPCCPQIAHCTQGAERCRRGLRARAPGARAAPPPRGRARAAAASGRHARLQTAPRARATTRVLWLRRCGFRAAQPFPGGARACRRRARTGRGSGLRGGRPRRALRWSPRLFPPRSSPGSDRLRAQRDLNASDPTLGARRAPRAPSRRSPRAPAAGATRRRPAAARRVSGGGVGGERGWGGETVEEVHEQKPAAASRNARPAQNHARHRRRPPVTCTQFPGAQCGSPFPSLPPSPSCRVALVCAQRGVHPPPVGRRLGREHGQAGDGGEGQGRGRRRRAGRRRRRAPRALPRAPLSRLPFGDLDDVVKLEHRRVVRATVPVVHHEHAAGANVAQRGERARDAKAAVNEDRVSRAAGAELGRQRAAVARESGGVGARGGRAKGAGGAWRGERGEGSGRPPAPCFSRLSPSPPLSHRCPRTPPSAPHSPPKTGRPPARAARRTRRPRFRARARGAQAARRATSTRPSPTPRIGPRPGRGA